MSEDKLRSDEVPQKFVEWLLAMGCPPENVPPVDKISEMCRGQYYMVWRSLMEKVEAKDVVRSKRLQVFCDDVRKCQKNKVFNERDTNVIVPEELSLWEQHSQVKEKVTDAEVRVIKEKENLHQLMDKVSSKLSQRNLSYKRLQDAQRRAWFLHQVSEELKEKRANLQETKDIAESLCGLDEGADIENKLEKCVVALSRHGATASSKSAGVSLLSAANPAACSSIASTNSENNDEEVISSLVKCRGDVLFKQLYEKRAGLCAAIPASHADKTVEHVSRVTPQSVLSHTAALHCSLALEAMKNRIHIKNTRHRLATSVNELSDYLSGEACELLVIRCERARTEARLASLRSSCEELTARGGVFATGSHQAPASSAANHIHSVDRAIESKRDELRRLITSVATIERKTQNAKDCLVSCFNSFHDDAPSHDGDRFNGRSSLPQESVLALRHFYEEKSERRRNKMDLSMDFDSSENYSFGDPIENGSPKFIDELKLYLKKFNLENNRKLVLDDGEKIWTFESLQSQIGQAQAKWQSDDIATSLLCPSVNLKQNLRRVARLVARKAELEEMVRALDSSTKKSATEIDISASTEEEQRILDKIKKRLNENIISLQKTNKTLDIGVENLRLWAENNMRKHISISRTVNGKTYKEYEDAYFESLQM